MPNVIVDLPGSLKIALDQEVARIKRSTSSVVTQALSAIPRDAGSYPIPSVDRWYVQHGGRAGSAKVGPKVRNRVRPGGRPRRR
jgi:hypothetical protein